MRESDVQASSRRSFGELWTRDSARRAVRPGMVHPLAAAMALAAALMTVTVASAGTQTGTPATSPARRDPTGTAQRIVGLINLQRERHGLPPLRVSARLEDDARLQARQIAATGVFAHVIPGQPYPTPAARAHAAGYRWNILGENLAWGYPDAFTAVAAWMGSPGHRSNILNRDYTETGVVLTADAQGNTIVVQTFGTPES